jgi:hypothetical protein
MRKKTARREQFAHRINHQIASTMIDDDIQEQKPRQGLAPQPPNPPRLLFLAAPNLFSYPKSEPNGTFDSFFL